MKRKEKKHFIRNNTIVNRILCFTFVFVIVVTMGVFSEHKESVVKADNGSNILTVHFKNELNWERVYAYFGDSDWRGISGYENAVDGYGRVISEDRQNEGWYTYEVTLPGEIDTVCGLFDNGSWDVQTGDYSISVSGDTEVWVVARLKADADPLPVVYEAPEDWNHTEDDGEDSSNEDDEDTAVAAAINVEKIPGLSENFIHGVDVSTHLSQLQSGVKYYDEDGKEADLFDILEEAGVNYVRLRVWNCPFRLDENGDYTYVEADGQTEHSQSEVVREERNAVGFMEYYLADGTTVYRKSYGAGICDVDTAAVIGKMATEHNMKVLIDFHYSDFWADPNKKSVPKLWETFTLEEKEQALYDFTKESLETLLDVGVDVGMVQIGNEINNGMAGEKTYDGVHALLRKGSEAVRAVSSERNHDILIAVHFTNPSDAGYQLGRAWELDQAGVDYDVFGTSYYPYWHGSPENLTENLKEIAETYHKKVMVCEVAYLWTTEDGDGYGNLAGGSDSDKEYNYPINEEGQAAAVRDTIAAVAAVGENGIGTFYWEPAWVPVNEYDADAENAEEILKENEIAWKVYGSGWATIYANDYDYEIRDERNGGSWDNQALFDFSGKALPSINVYKYVYTGAKGPTRVSVVEAASCEMQYGEEPALPRTVNVDLNDGTVISASVTWDAGQTAELKTADFGEYTVSGTVGAFSYYEKMNDEQVEVAAGTWKATCKVTVTGYNYVFNGGFENEEQHDAGWTMTKHEGMGEEDPRAEYGPQNAKSGDYFYQGWDESLVDFSIDQVIESELPDGNYMLFAYYQGTGVGETMPESALYAVITYKDGTSKTLSAPVEIHNVWKDFYQAKVKDIVIDDSVESVQVGTRIACTANPGAWVTVDDISLMKAGDLEISKSEEIDNLVEKGDDEDNTQSVALDQTSASSAGNQAETVGSEVKTGDNAPILPALLMLVMAVGMVAAALVRRKRVIP